MALGISGRTISLAVAMLAAGALSANAQSVVLAWDPSPEPDVAGYRVYYGTSPRTYTTNVDAGRNTTHEVTGLDLTKEYYFAVRAYTDTGLLSPLSEEVTQPAAFPPGATLSGLSASVSAPFLTGQSIVWTAAGNSTLGPVEYRFFLSSPASGWRIVQDYGPANSWTWTPKFDDLGGHTLQVWARTVGSPAPYEAWLGTPAFEVTAQPVRLTADVEFPIPPKQPVRWTASVAGATDELEYRFLLLNRGTGVWSEVRGYGASNEWTWTPDTTGSYNLQVWVRQAGSAAAYQLWAGTETLRVSRSPLAIAALTADRTMPAKTGTRIQWTARSRGGTHGPVEFAFYRYSVDLGTWQMVQGYSTSNTYAWTPTLGEQGRYVIQAWARNSGSTAPYDAWAGTNSFEITQAPLELATTSLFPVPPGTAVGWEAKADTSENLEYAYWLYEEASGTWSNVRPYSPEADFTWRPSASGRYLVQAWARRIGSTAAFEVWRGSDYLEVSVSPAKITALTTDVTLPSAPGVPITWTASGSGGTQAPLQYRFYLYTEGQGWRLLRDYAPASTVTWTPTASDIGTHALQVWVRSAGSAAAYEGWMGTASFVIRP